MSNLLAPRALLPDGWAHDVRIRVRGGLIERVQAGPQAEEVHGHSTRLGGTVLPGVPNLHSHTFQRLMAGRAERRSPVGVDSFWTWREEMYRIAASLGPDEVEAVAALAFLEMLEAGFTSVAEFHYLHHGRGGAPYADPAENAARIIRAADAVGIGLTLLPVFYAHGHFGGEAHAPGQAPFVTSPERYGRLVESARCHADATGEGPGGPVVVGVAPHSLRAVTPDKLDEVVALAHGSPIHIHVAEQIDEVDACVAWSGARPVEWLLSHQRVDGTWCLVHATHMTREETTTLARSGAVAGLCPVTEANLGDGIFPAVDFLTDGGRFGVGSDSNVRICAAEELRLLEYGQRLRDRARNRLALPDRSTGRCLLESTLEGGSRAVGRPVGRIAPGHRADFLVLAEDHPSLAGILGGHPHGATEGRLDVLLDAWIFSGGRELLREVWVGGQQRLLHGSHERGPEIRARYSEVAARVLS